MNQNESTLLQTEKPKANIIVVIIAWLFLLGFLTRILFSLSVIVRGGSFLSLLIDISWLIIYLGLRKMKRWGLYVLTLVTLLSLYDVISVLSQGKKIDWFLTIILLSATAYCWTIFKRFRK